MSKSERNRASQQTHRHDPEAQRRHLKRQLDSLERDNHSSLNNVDDLVSIIALAQQQEENMPQRKRAEGGKANVYAAKTNLNILLEDTRAEIDNSLPSYFSCAAKPSRYPPRNFCSVCGFSSHYKCVRCGMKYCSRRCLTTHEETRCLKWTT
ncbi:hypothetical protein BCR43DRAFT_481816 [Syncephalastrum racemosum]|uniref:HIT-type domain-containing protein n=1 Tax=Syncephalastrum racemosum TaxID=13706 RepID=A0A1X2HSQ0_SYNRA|nr:hypothetical protein BCR43DRAFT_481816 [Syncephalastrum racemosum]